MQHKNTFTTVSLTLERYKHYLFHKSIAIVRGPIVYVGSNGDDTKGIDGRMATIVMLLYVVHIHSVRDSWNLIDVLGIIEQIWILPYQFLVAFEVYGIHLV